MTMSELNPVPKSAPKHWGAIAAALLAALIALAAVALSIASLVVSVQARDAIVSLDKAVGIPTN